MNNAPRQQEENEQHGEAIGVTHVAENIELELSQYRADGDALQAVSAAGDPRNLVRDLTHDQGNAERHHEAREIRSAQHEKARGESKNYRRSAGHDKGQHRLVDDGVLAQERRDIGAEAEKRGMAK